MSKTQRETAGYRARLKAVEQQLAASAAASQSLATEQERHASLTRTAAVQRVAQEFDLPEELADVLQGEDADGLRAHAARLSRLAHGDGDYGDFDPVAAARAARISNGTTTTDDGSTDQ